MPKKMYMKRDLGQMAAILDFTHNAMSKVIPDHTWYYIQYIC